ncbi:hypothetical protein GEMRC1_007236 [Eukaryota sp. GEM-RC1]
MVNSATIHYLSGTDGTNQPKFSPRNKQSLGKKRYMSPLNLRHLAATSPKSSPRHNLGPVQESPPFLPPPTSRTFTSLPNTTTISSPRSSFPHHQSSRSGTGNKEVTNRSTSPINTPSLSPLLLIQLPLSIHLIVTQSFHTTKRQGSLMPLSDVMADTHESMSASSSFALPDSLLPSSVHIFENTVMATADDYDQSDLIVKDGEVKRRVFPTNTPSELRKRDQTALLVSAIKKLSPSVVVPSDTALTLENERQLLLVAGRELVRQVTVECSERGQLLDVILRRYDSLAAAAPLILRNASEEVSKRSKILANLRLTFQHHEEEIVRVAKEREEHLLNLIHHLELHLEAFDDELTRLRASILDEASSDSTVLGVTHPLAVLLGEAVLPPSVGVVPFSSRFVGRFITTMLLNPKSCKSFSDSVSTNASVALYESIHDVYSEIGSRLVYSLVSIASQRSQYHSLLRKFFAIPILPQFSHSTALAVATCSLVCQWALDGKSEAPIDHSVMKPSGCSLERAHGLFQVIIRPESADVAALSTSLIEVDDVMARVLGLSTNYSSVSYIPLVNIATVAFDAVRASSLDSKCLPVPPSVVRQKFSPNIVVSTDDWPDTHNPYVRKAKFAAALGLFLLSVGYLQMGLIEASRSMEINTIGMFTSLLKTIQKTGTECYPVKDDVYQNCDLVFKLQRSIRKYFKSKKC